MKPKLLSVFTGLAMAAFAAGAGSAKANVIFGDLAPTAGACPAVSGPGLACSFDLTFASGTDTVNVHGFLAGPPAGGETVGNTNLTLKPSAISPLAPPSNGPDEAGLGVNGTAQTPPTSCTDPDCEIVSPHSVTAYGALGTVITDAIIGSVQAGESFNFFVDNGAGLAQLGGTVDSSCMGAPGFSVGPNPASCIWNAPAGQTRLGVAVQGVNGNVLLTAVSTPAPAVPEPASLALLGSGLAALGLLRRRRQKS